MNINKHIQAGLINQYSSTSSHTYITKYVQRNGPLTKKAENNIRPAGGESKACPTKILRQATVITSTKPCSTLVKKTNCSRYPNECAKEEQIRKQ